MLVTMMITQSLQSGRAPIPDLMPVWPLAVKRKQHFKLPQAADSRHRRCCCMTSLNLHTYIHLRLLGMQSLDAMVNWWGASATCYSHPLAICKQLTS